MFSRLARRVALSARTHATTQTIRNSNAILGAIVASTLAASVVYRSIEPVQCASIPSEGIPGTNTERTFIAIKPDGVDRQLIGKIIQRFEQKGFKLVAIKMLQPTKELAQGHYDDLKSKPFFPSLVNYFSSGPIVAMVWEGKNVILTGRKLLGATNPADSAVGTIRGDFCIDVGRNIIHGSDAADSAKHEINFWFTPQEITAWQSSSAKWVYEKP